MNKLAMVLGIRPDIVRASIIIKKMKSYMGDNFVLIWSGQHYSENLKDVFFHELEVASPDIELGIKGSSDAELVGDLLPKLSRALQDIQPSAIMFLGDTNTVAGSLAAAQLNIPIVHIEGCMRSYDWRMPEEKYRKLTDHLSDLIFAYLPEYKLQGIAEGIPEANIEVTGNPIVDVLQTYYFGGKLRLTGDKFNELKKNKYGLLKSTRYALMTAHRRENIQNEVTLRRVVSLAGAVGMPVIFPAGYGTQKALQNFKIVLPKNIIQVDPIGYLEILELLVNAEITLSDSGTLIEEACILGTPSIQMRRSTERPQVYTWGASIKYDPSINQDPLETVRKVFSLDKSSWVHEFGDGLASDQMFHSIIEKLERGELARHDPKNYTPWSLESFKSEIH